MDLSFDLNTIFPAVHYSDAKFRGTHAQLWMLPGMYEGANLDKNNEIIYRGAGQRLDDETKMIADVLSDIAHYPPAIIVVKEKTYGVPGIGDGFKFDFVKYFSLTKTFKEIWKNYEEIDRIDDRVIYRYKAGGTE